MRNGNFCTTTIERKKKKKYKKKKSGKKSPGMSKHPKKGRETPTSGCACTHPREPPSGSRDLRSRHIVTSDQGRFLWRHFRWLSVVPPPLTTTTKATWKPLIYYLNYMFLIAGKGAKTYTFFFFELILTRAQVYYSNGFLVFMIAVTLVQKEPLVGFPRLT